MWLLVCENVRGRRAPVLNCCWTVKQRSRTADCCAAFWSSASICLLIFLLLSKWSFWSFAKDLWRGRTVRLIGRDCSSVREEKLPERGGLGWVLGSSTADRPVQECGPSAGEKLKTSSVGLILCKSGQFYCGQSASIWWIVRRSSWWNNKFWEGSGIMFGTTAGNTEKVNLAWKHRKRDKAY